MKTLKIVLLVAATALIPLLTPRAAAAQSHCGDLIYQTGINSDGPPGAPDGDCSESGPIIGSIVASALAVGLVLLFAIRSFVLGASPKAIPEPAPPHGRTNNAAPEAKTPASPVADSADGGTPGVHPRTPSLATGIPSAQTEAETYAAELRAAGGRPPTAASVAVDRTTGAVSRGASGELTVRPAALERVLPNPSVEPWSVANCAEVAACSSAIAKGSLLRNLDVWTVRTSTGDFFPPCGNCVTWVPGLP